MTLAVHGLMLVDDLIFFSLVATLAKSQSLVVRQARSTAGLLELSALHRPSAVIVDLQFPDLDIESLLQQIRIEPGKPRIIGYGSHVDFETLRRARQAGCDRVMPRSQFVDELEAELPIWLGVKTL